MSAPKLFTFEEIVTGLTDLGIPREMAERQARQECGIPEVVTSGYVQIVGEPLTYPIRLTLPWSALESDNAKHGAIARRGTDGEPHALLIMQAGYRTAKGKAAKIARETMRGFPAIAHPCKLTALVYVPDNRKHDVCNFAKCCHDALEKIVYENDALLYDVRWVRAGVDEDHPRAEVTVAIWDAALDAISALSGDR